MNGNINKWNATPKELVVLSDGQYWMPSDTSEIYTNVYDIYPNGFREDQNNVFGTGKRTLNIRFEYLYFESDAVEDAVEVWLAVYRAGQPEPVWAEAISMDEIESKYTITAEMELFAGKHFIMISHVGLDDSMKSCETMAELGIQLPCGIRYDFMVKPLGTNLVHPEIRELKLTSRPLSEWKERLRDNYVEVPTADAQLILQKPFDMTDNFLHIEIFDESLNWIAWSDYATNEGNMTITSFFPILDAEYRFVIMHNQTPIVCGAFVSCDGRCAIRQMEKWGTDTELAKLLDSPYKKQKLKFQPTAYGRRMELLEDIMMFGDDDSILNEDRLEKKLEEIGKRSKSVDNNEL